FSELRSTAPSKSPRAACAFTAGLVTTPLGRVEQATPATIPAARTVPMINGLKWCLLRMGGPPGRWFDLRRDWGSSLRRGGRDSQRANLFTWHPRRRPTRFGDGRKKRARPVAG